MLAPLCGRGVSCRWRIQRDHHHALQCRGTPAHRRAEAAHLAAFTTLESKSVFVSERGLTSTQWSEYSENTKRIQYSAVPTSDITAETVTVDCFTLSR